MDEGLGSSYILLSEMEEGAEEGIGRGEERADGGAERRSRKRRRSVACRTEGGGVEEANGEMLSSVEEERFINILTPKKEKSLIFLTPVKRTKRMVINGLKSGEVKVCSSFLEVKNEGKEDYVPLVERFSRLEKLERIERRRSIDKIVDKYVKKREE